MLIVRLIESPFLYLLKSTNLIKSSVTLVKSNAKALLTPEKLSKDAIALYEVSELSFSNGFQHSSP